MDLVALAVGHVTLDRSGEELLPGGSAWYAAHAYRALGARARLATAAGPDLPPGALHGLEAEVAVAERTTRFVNAYSPEGRRAQRVEAAAPPLDPRALPGPWRAPDVLHLAPVLGEVDLAAFVSAAPARVVGIGVQGWVRAVRANEVIQPRWEIDPDALRGVTAAIVGEDDLRGQGDLVARLAAAVPLVVLTLGARGCELIERGRARRVGVFATREVDPTGAGDVFSAGLLLGLARGMGAAKAACLGAAAASVIVEGRGGAALPRLAEAWERARKIHVEAGSRGPGR